MNILSIDPSIVKLGWAVIEINTGNLITSGTLKTRQEGEARIPEIVAFIVGKAKEYKCQIMGIETQYLTGVMSNSILKTSQVMGACQGAFVSISPENIYYSVGPSEVKKSLGITGKRKELKQMTILMMSRLYGLDKIDDNEADAIAIGLTVSKELRKIK